MGYDLSEFQEYWKDTFHTYYVDVDTVKKIDIQRVLDPRYLRIKVDGFLLGKIKELEYEC